MHDRAGVTRELWAWSKGWLWLLVAADRQVALAGQKRKRLRAAIAALVARHPGERALWLRFSAPSREALMRAVGRWRKYREDHDLELDAVRVIDRGATGELVYHVHVLGFGVPVELELESQVIARAGAYGFIHAEYVDAESRGGYMVKRLRGYLGAKESGWRHLRVPSRAERELVAGIRSRFSAR